MSYKRLTSAYGTTIPNCGAIGWFLDISDPSPISNNVIVDIGWKVKNNAPYRTLFYKNIYLPSRRETYGATHIPPRALIDLDTSLYCTWHFVKSVTDINNYKYVLHKHQLFIGSMRRYSQAKSETTLEFKKSCWICGTKNYLGPEGPIYGYLDLWS